jgi:hypothetical protein
MDTHTVRCQSADAGAMNHSPTTRVNITMFFKKSTPKDAPHSTDQSDIPDTSQLMPLEGAPPQPRPKPLNAMEERDGVYVSSRQIEQLRTLIARRDKAQAELNAFYQQFVEQPATRRG